MLVCTAMCRVQLYMECLTVCGCLSVDTEYLVDSWPDASSFQQLLDFLRAEVGHPNASDQALGDALLHGCPSLVEGRRHLRPRVL